MPIITAKTQEEFDNMVLNHEVVVVLFCAKYRVPKEVILPFGRLSLKVPEYKFCYIDLKERPDIRSRVRITGDYAISIYRGGGLAKAFTLADMEFYSCLTTMDKASLDGFVNRAIENHSSFENDDLAPSSSNSGSARRESLQSTSSNRESVSMPSPPSPSAGNNNTTPAVTNAATGSASVTVGAQREPHVLPQVNYPPAQHHPTHMPTPYGNPAILPPSHPMYIYSNYPYPPPPSPTSAAGYSGGFAGSINVNSANSSAVDSGRLVGNHLSELVALKVAEKISTQGAVPLSGSINVSVNVDVNIRFQ